VGGSSSNTFTGNSAARNALGFAALDRSSNNIIRKNTARTNTVWDALDDGTGTGNLWIANVFGKTSGI
jgi:parallel beta-helix repeat protein